ncbi:MAG: energy-coupled thiamine transporter ThiT [Oscillospiraceae bacterium]|nr:energy-coupled thiamine transporter ThiT [Oscillospiraceae bacterium]
MTKKLVLSGIMLGMATVLSMIKVYSLPMGGSITLLSMLPVCLLSIKYGVKWGLFTAFTYCLIQIMLDLGSIMTWGLTAGMWLGCIVFDYLLAFTVLGLAGLFRNKGIAGITGGIFLTLALRFICHFAAGVIIWDVWMPDDWSNIWIYSLAYNGSYMLPELVFTLLGAAALFAAPQTRKLLADN